MAVYWENRILNGLWSSMRLVTLSLGLSTQVVLCGLWITGAIAHPAPPLLPNRPTSPIEQPVLQKTPKITKARKQVVEARLPSFDPDLTSLTGISSNPGAVPQTADLLEEEAIAPPPPASPAPLISQTPPPPAPPTPTPHTPQLDLDPAIIQNSPVLQRWLRAIPDVLYDIHHDPSFRTRLRLTYSRFPSTDDDAGFLVGVEDIFVGHTGLTASGEYQRTFNGKRETYGGDVRYYILPLGSYFNVAPVIGYRHLETDKYTTDGVNVGLRLLLALSRTGAADIAVTQSWVDPGGDQETGMTTLSFGYALTHNLRLSTDLQQQNARQGKDYRIGIGLEWML